MTDVTEPQLTAILDLCQAKQAEADALDRELIDVLAHAYISPEKQPILYRRIGRLLKARQA